MTGAFLASLGDKRSGGVSARGNSGRNRCRQMTDQPTTRRFLMPHTRGLADAFGDRVNGRSGADAGIGAAV